MDNPRCGADRSTATISASCASLTSASLATLSSIRSAWGADRLEIPGRSTNSTVRPLMTAVPLFRSTVTPGQLPIVCRAPVSMLNSVDLPELAGPSRKTRYWAGAQGRRSRRTQPGAAQLEQPIRRPSPGKRVLVPVSSGDCCRNRSHSHKERDGPTRPDPRRWRRECRHRPRCAAANRCREED